MARFLRQNNWFIIRLSINYFFLKNLLYFNNRQDGNIDKNDIKDEQLMRVILNNNFSFGSEEGGN